MHYTGMNFFVREKDRYISLVLGKKERTINIISMKDTYSWKSRRWSVVISWFVIKRFCGSQGNFT
jgi:hypothetical protein